MPWKINETSKKIDTDENGRPIWTGETGEERAVDYPELLTELGRLSGEAAEAKKNLTALEDKLKETEAGSAPPVEPGEFEARLEAATRPLQDKIADLETKLAESRAKLEREAVKSAFNESAYVRDKLVDPRLAADLFAKYFSVGDSGQVIAKDEEGRPIYGEKGEAPFDEALARLVEAYPGRDYILKAAPGQGSGAGRPGGRAAAEPADSRGLIEAGLRAAL